MGVQKLITFDWMGEPLQPLSPKPLSHIILLFALNLIENYIYSRKYGSNITKRFRDLTNIWQTNSFEFDIDISVV